MMVKFSYRIQIVREVINTLILHSTDVFTIDQNREKQKSSNDLSVSLETRSFAKKVIVYCNKSSFH